MPGDLNEVAVRVPAKEKVGTVIPFARFPDDLDPVRPQIFKGLGEVIDLQGDVAHGGWKSLITDHEMELRPHSHLIPMAGKVELRPGDRLQPQDLAVEPSGSLQIPNDNCYVVVFFYANHHKALRIRICRTSCISITM
jgi:hypothetical protein